MKNWLPSVFAWLTNRRKLIAICVLLLGVMDVLLIFATAAASDVDNPLSAALGEALNDPGKDFFHIVLLPLALFVFFDEFDLTILQAKPMLLSLGILLFLGLLAFWAGHIAHSHYRSTSEATSQLASPADYGNAGCSKELFRLRGAQRVQPMASWRSLKDAYRDTASKCADASIRSWWSIFLTGVGLIAVVLVIWEVVLRVVFVRRSRERNQILLTAASLLTIWIPLRVYSDWYLNFGIQDPRTFVGIGLIVVLAALLVILPVWIMQLSRIYATKVILLIWSGASAIVGAVAAVKAQWIANFVAILSALQLSELGLIYLLLSGLIVLTAVLLVTWAKRPPGASQFPVPVP
jgi:hypothetical protein